MSGPHADFVKGILSEIELAAEFFALTLQSEVLKRIDLSTLRLEEGSFVDDQNRPYYSDLLFSVDSSSGGSLQFFFLFEHKSHPDYSILDQLAVYQALVYRKQGKRSKSPVFPIVFYHGMESWNVPLTFQGQVSFPDLEIAQDLLNFRYTLVNVRETRIDELEASIRQKAFWWTLAQIRELTSEEKVRDFLEIVAEYYEKLPEDYLGKLVAYILRVQDIEVETFEQLLQQTISTNKARIVMSTLEKLEEKARIAGKLEGKLEDARNLLANGVSIEIILNSTGLNREQLIEAGILPG